MKAYRSVMSVSCSTPASTAASHSPMTASSCRSATVASVSTSNSRPITAASVEYAVCFFAESMDAPGDDLTDTDGQARRPQVGGRGPVAGVVLEDGAGFCEVAQHLTDEERIAVGLVQ